MLSFSISLRLDDCKAAALDFIVDKLRDTELTTDEVPSVFWSSLWQLVSARDDQPKFGARNMLIYIVHDGIALL
jgi:hypothetical protein